MNAIKSYLRGQPVQAYIDGEHNGVKVAPKWRNVLIHSDDGERDTVVVEWRGELWAVYRHEIMPPSQSIAN